MCGWVGGLSLSGGCSCAVSPVWVRGHEFECDCAAHQSGTALKFKHGTILCDNSFD